MKSIISQPNKEESKSDLKKAIKKALAGSRTLNLTFKREAVDKVRYLCGLERGGAIRIDDATAIILSKVMHAGNWQDDSDRVVIIQLAENFDLKLFEGERLENYLESIQAIKA